jgi:hypothetical protein
LRQDLIDQLTRAYVRAAPGELVATTLRDRASGVFSAPEKAPRRQPVAADVLSRLLHGEPTLTTSGSPTCKSWSRRATICIWSAARRAVTGRLPFLSRYRSPGPRVTRRFRRLLQVYRHDGRQDRAALRFWLAGLNFALIAVGVALTLNGTRRALFVVALVPLVFAPFAYARLRLHRERPACARSAPHGVAAAASAPLRRRHGRPAPDRAWHRIRRLAERAGDRLIGPVWFSAHALLFLAYALLGLGRLLGK